MIGYILLAIFIGAASANDARLTGWDRAAYDKQQLALQAQNGVIQGEYKQTPTTRGVSHWTNEVLAIPRGATQITIINHNINNVKIAVGYKGPNRGSLGYEWWTKSGDLVEHSQAGGVNFVYARTGQQAIVTISGPANPTDDAGSDLNIIVGVQRTNIRNLAAGHITWKYNV